MDSTVAIGTPGYLMSGGAGVCARVEGGQWPSGPVFAKRALRSDVGAAQPKHARPMAIDLPTTGMPSSALERRP